MFSQDETGRAGDARGFKRSETVTLVLLGGAGIAAVGLAKVDPSQRMEDIRIYPNAEACIAGHVRMEADCRADYDTARRTAAETAPTYPTKALCEEQHGVGECQADTGAGERARPLMAAYLVGITPAQKLDPQPLFRAVTTSEIRGVGAFTQLAYRTSWGCPVNPAAFGASSAARVPAASVRPALFGGFGATGRAICGDEESHGGGG